jgi:hypothetical protein
VGSAPLRELRNLVTNIQVGTIIMARFSSTLSFDQRALNLNLLTDWSEVKYFDNYIFQRDGRTYQDSYDVYWSDDAGQRLTQFYGNNLTVNVNVLPTGGTFTGI